MDSEAEQVALIHLFCCSLQIPCPPYNSTHTGSGRIDIDMYCNGNTSVVVASCMGRTLKQCHQKYWISVTKKFCTDSEVCAEILSWQSGDRQWSVCWDTELTEWRQTVKCVLRYLADRVATDSDVCAEILSWQSGDRQWRVCWDTELTEWRQTVKCVLRYWADIMMTDSNRLQWSCW